MSNFKAAETTLYFNTRDEMIRVKLDRVAYFESDANYCNVVFINGAKATLLTSLVNMEELLSKQFKESARMFIRIGKRYIVNRNFIFHINIPRQRLVFSDYVTVSTLEISLSKEALKNLKNLYGNI